MLSGGEDGDRDLAALTVRGVVWIELAGSCDALGVGGAVAEFCGICRRVVARVDSRSLRWTCCAGSGSCGRSGWSGTVPRGREARDFCRWMMLAGVLAGPTRAGASVRVHAETVLRGFYDFHLEAGTGPILNRSRSIGLAARPPPCSPQSNGAFRNERAGRYRPTVPTRIPRSVPMGSSTRSSPARLASRPGLVAFYVSTGAGRRSCCWSPGRRRCGATADHGDTQGRCGPAAAGLE